MLQHQIVVQKSQCALVPLAFQWMHECRTLWPFYHSLSVCVSLPFLVAFVRAFALIFPYRSIAMTQTQKRPSNILFTCMKSPKYEMWWPYTIRLHSNVHRQNMLVYPSSLSLSLYFIFFSYSFSLLSFDVTTRTFFPVHVHIGHRNAFFPPFTLSFTFRWTISISN